MSIDNLSSDTFNEFQRIGDSNNSITNNYNTSDQITFFNYAYSYCICIVDIVNSTNTAKELTNPEKIRKYYSIFLNTMASIIKQDNGKVVKNTGDCLIYYFPRTARSSSESAFQDVLECGLAMIRANSDVNSYLNRNNLPSISYRISANYGRVELACSTNSNTVDLFGPAVNICSKINTSALPNQMVIYKDLYDIIERKSFFKDYYFGKISKSQININYCAYPYMIYSVSHVGNSQKQHLRQNKSIHHKYHHPSIAQNQKIQNKSNSAFNILIIDDDEDFLYALNTFLDLRGYNSVSYSDPSKAWGHFSVESPYYFDLIITDIRMREINGIKLYFKFKAINPEIKILFISGLDVVDELLTMLPDIKSDDIITKPIELKYILSKIKTILDQ